MISSYKYKDITWVDLESPTQDELLHLMSEYSIPDHLLNELITETILSKVDEYRDMIYMTLHFPRIHNEKRMPDMEIDFILSHNFLITIHYEFSNAIHDFAKDLEVDVMLSRDSGVTNAGHLFHALILKCYKQSANKLDDLYQMLEEIKNNVFLGGEDKLVTDISRLNRKMLDFKQALRFHDGIYKSFEKSSTKLYGESYLKNIESMRSEYQKISGVLEGHREMLMDLRFTNDSLLSAKTNKTMRILTIMSFTTFPLTLFATMLAMITHVDIINTKEQFLYIVTTIILVGILIILHFRKRKWLL